jgi:hypothetical protein
MTCPDIHTKSPDLISREFLKIDVSGHKLYMSGHQMLMKRQMLMKHFPFLFFFFFVFSCYPLEDSSILSSSCCFSHLGDCLVIVLEQVLLSCLSFSRLVCFYYYFFSNMVVEMSCVDWVVQMSCDFLLVVDKWLFK